MIEQEEYEIVEKKGISVGQFLMFLFVMFLAAVLIWSYNVFRLKVVTVEGLTRYSEQEFTAKIEEGFWNTITPLFCLSDSFAQKEIPFIEKYEIDYAGRQSARVIVHEKRVTGCVLIMGNYMYFDKDGIVVETLDRTIEGIPVIDGLEFDEIVLYQKLQVQKSSLFDTILDLTRLIEDKGIPVQKISFDSNYEVTLHTGEFQVLLGKKANYDEAIGALRGIVEKISGRKGTVDMRNFSSENQEGILKETN